MFRPEGSGPSGHGAAPPNKLMNSRRLIAGPPFRVPLGLGPHSQGANNAGCEPPQPNTPPSQRLGGVLFLFDAKKLDNREEDLRRSGLEQHSDMQIGRPQHRVPDIAVSKDVAVYCVNLLENVCEMLEWKMNDGAFDQTFMKNLMKETGFLASTN